MDGFHVIENQRWSATPIWITWNIALAEKRTTKACDSSSVKAGLNPISVDALESQRFSSLPVNEQPAPLLFLVFPMLSWTVTLFYTEPSHPAIKMSVYRTNFLNIAF